MWRALSQPVLALFLGLLLGLSLRQAVTVAWPRDLQGQYAGSPNKAWFDRLASKKGPCCSDADGTALSDVDWRSHDGHYEVRIEGEWMLVPDDAVLAGPNLVGRTMVWPVYYRSMGAPVRVEIRCFLPGSMT